MKTRINSYDTIAANAKTNGVHDPERFTVNIGERYERYEFGEQTGIVTITAENKQSIEDEINDRENDVTSYMRIEEHTDGWHVHGEWLCDSENHIIKKPLSFWFNYYGVIPTEWRGYELWRSTKTGKYMDIEKNGGYGLRHDQYEAYKDKLFFVGNADLDSPKLRQCPRD